MQLSSRDMSAHALGELESAIRTGDCATARRLCATCSIDVNAARDAGNSLLHHACERAELEPVVLLLLELRADVNATNDNGASPLHRALRDGHAEIALILVRHGADIEHCNHRGRSALSYARGRLQQQLEDEAAAFAKQPAAAVASPASEQPRPAANAVVQRASRAAAAASPAVLADAALEPLLGQAEPKAVPYDRLHVRRRPDCVAPARLLLVRQQDVYPHGQVE